MSQIKRISMYLLSVWWCVWGVFFPVQATAEERAEIKIGAILPLTGALATIGRDMQRGITLASEEARHVRFTLSFEDDKTADRVAAVNAAKKMTSVHKVDVLFNGYVSSVSALAPTVKRAQVPLVVLWDSNETIPSYGRYVFGFGYGNELAGQDMARFVREKLGKGTAAIISIHDEWSELMARSFREEFLRLGGKIVSTETVDGTTTDFRTLVTRLRRIEAGALYAPLYGAGLRSLMKQVREMKFAGAFLTADSLSDYDVREVGESAEGVYLTQAWFADEAFVRKVSNRFGESTGSEVNLGYVALGYDAVMMLDALAAKLESQGKPINSTEITSALPGFSFEGVLGETVISENRTVERREPIVVVRDGAFRLQ